MSYRQSEFEKAKRLFPRGTRVEIKRNQGKLWGINLLAGYRGTVESFTKDRIAVRWDLDGELYELRFKSGFLGVNGISVLYDYLIKPVSPIDLLAEEPGYEKKLSRHRRKHRRMLRRANRRSP